MPFCKTCKQTKDDNEFYIYKKTGKPRGVCKACYALQYQKAMSDPDKKLRKRQSQKRWYQENTEYAKQLSKDWYDKPENHERTRLSRNACNRNRYLIDPTVKARKQKYKAASLERRKDDPDFIRKNHVWVMNKNHRRRARMLRAIEDVEALTEQQWKELCDKYGRKCLCCNHTDMPLTLDHITPITKGGKHTLENAQPLCKGCNTRKGTKTIDYRPK